MAYKHMEMSESLSPPSIAQMARSLCFNAHTIWLFLYNDIKTTIVPSVAFAFANSIAFRRLPILLFLSRMPILVLWICINLLGFTANNQRPPCAVEEDRINKPWRPIPSGRIDPKQAKYLGRIAYAFGVWLSLLFNGGATEASLLVVLGYLYNDLGWSGNWVIRNIINAVGITVFLAGSLSAALQSPISADMVPWFCIIAAVICTTIHIQDMHDQPGDAAAGRTTLPLVLGDGPARWTITGGLLFWSLLTPWYWGISLPGYLLMIGQWTIISWRSLSKRTVKEDRITFRLYNIWLMTVYLLPLATTI